MAKMNTATTATATHDPMTNARFGSTLASAGALSLGMFAAPPVAADESRRFFPDMFALSLRRFPKP